MPKWYVIVVSGAVGCNSASASPTELVEGSEEEEEDDDEDEEEEEEEVEDG